VSYAKELCIEISLKAGTRHPFGSVDIANIRLIQNHFLFFTRVLTLISANA